MKKMRKTKMRSKKNARKTKRIRGGSAQMDYNDVAALLEKISDLKQIVMNKKLNQDVKIEIINMLDKFHHDIHTGNYSKIQIGMILRGIELDMKNKQFNYSSA